MNDHDRLWLIFRGIDKEAPVFDADEALQNLIETSRTLLGHLRYINAELGTPVTPEQLSALLELRSETLALMAEVVRTADHICLKAGVSAQTSTDPN